MIDLRDIGRQGSGTVHSFLEFVPDSIRNDPEIIALSQAIEPEMHFVATAINEAIALPRIAELDDPILDEIAWGFRLNELTLWTDATTEGKRRLLAQIMIIMKRSGTVFAVKRIFDLLQLTGRIVEWFEEAAPAYTYRIIIDASEIGITLHVLQQIPELTYRFAPASRLMSQLAVEGNVSGQLLPYPVVGMGQIITIPFGGP